jgi:hypothetical protein
MESTPDSCFQKRSQVKPSRYRNLDVPGRSCLKNPPLEQHIIKTGGCLVNRSDLEIESSPRHVPGSIRKSPAPSDQRLNVVPQISHIANPQRSVSFPPDMKVIPRNRMKAIPIYSHRPPQKKNASLQKDTNSNSKPLSNLFTPGVRGPSRYVRFERESTIPNTPQMITFHHGIESKAGQASRTSSAVSNHNVANTNLNEVVSRMPSSIRNYKNWPFVRSPAEARDEIAPHSHSPLDDLFSVTLLQRALPWKNKDPQVAVNAEPYPRFWKRTDSVVSQGLSTISSNSSLHRPASSSFHGQKPRLASMPEIPEPISTHRPATAAILIAKCGSSTSEPSGQHSFSSRALQTKGSLRRVRRRASDAASDVVVQAQGMQRQVLDRFNSVVFPNKVKIEAQVVSRRSQRWSSFDDESDSENSFMCVRCAGKQKVSE